MNKKYNWERCNGADDRRRWL